MTVIYNYLGYGVTDNQGKAKLEYDSEGNPLTHSYTGTGAGKVDIVASLDSTITDSSLVSETYSIIDALFYDSGTTGTPNTKWIKNGGSFNATSDSTGLLIENTFTWAVYYRADLTDDASTRDYTAPFMVEFDLLDFNGTGNNTYITFDDGETTYPALRFDGSSITKDCHISIRVTTDNSYYKVDDGTEIALNKAVTGNCHISFQMAGGTDKYIKFKNFKVYPI